MARSYYRAFFALKEDTRGYSSGRTPQGRCVLEGRGSDGKVTIYVQDLKPEVPYSVYIIKTGDPVMACCLGQIETSPRFRAEARFECDANNPGGLGYPIEDYSAAAIMVKGSGADAPLIGGKDNYMPPRWRDAIHTVKIGREEVFETSPLTGKNFEAESFDSNKVLNDRNMDFQETGTKEVPLEEVNLKEADLKEADLKEVDLNKVLYNDSEGVSEPVLTERNEDSCDIPVTDEVFSSDPMMIDGEEDVPAPETSEYKEEVKEETDCETNADDNSVEDHNRFVEKGEDPHLAFRAIIQKFNQELDDLAEVASDNSPAQPSAQVNLPVNETFNETVNETVNETNSDSPTAEEIKDAQANSIDEVLSRCGDSTFFGGEPGWASISMRELALLPLDYTDYEQNTVIAAAYYKHGHFIVRKAREDSPKNYVLGVPEVYENENKRGFIRMGFHTFKCEQGDAAAGSMGYWLKEV